MQNPKDTDDLRARRTRKTLQQALIDLTIEKGFVDVTVRDIAERAMVNRSTFYRYYLDKYELLEQFMEDVYRLTAVEDEQAVTDQRPPYRSSTGLINMLNNVQQHADFYRVMFGPKGDPTFVQNVRTYIEKRFRLMMPTLPTSNDPSRPPLEASIRYISHAGIGIITWWLDNKQHSAEQVAEWLMQFSQADISVSLGLGRTPPDHEYS
jgi:AcrR family transcriptional regulator